MHFFLFPAHLSPQAQSIVEALLHVSSSENELLMYPYRYMTIYHFPFFLNKAYLYDSSVTGPSVLTLHDSACLPAALKPSCLVRQTVKRVGTRGGGSVGMQPCVHCFIKINHLDKDILRRIYIKQLQKQASVCEPVMQQDHTTSLHHRAGPGIEEKKEKKKKVLTGSRTDTPLKI